MKKYLSQIFLLGLLILLMSSCRNDPSFERGVKTFFATVFFMITMFIAGIPAIVFSAINIKSDKNSMKVLAIVFTSVFGLFSLLSLKMYTDIWSHKTSEWLSILCFIQYGSLLGCIIMMASKKTPVGKTISEPVVKVQSKTVQKPIAKTEDDDLDYLDKFLDDDLEEG